MQDAFFFITVPLNVKCASMRYFREREMSSPETHHIVQNLVEEIAITTKEIQEKVIADRDEVKVKISNLLVIRTAQEVIGKRRVHLKGGKTITSLDHEPSETLHPIEIIAHLTQIIETIEEAKVQVVAHLMQEV